MKKARTSSRPSKDAPEAVFAVRVQPRASKNEIVRMEGGKLKVRLTAPPVDGAANEALIKYISGILGITKSQVEIVLGQTGREKQIKIIGMSLADVQRLLNSTTK